MSTLSIARSTAKDLGMTFKEENCYYNGNQGYQLTDRKTGEVIATGFTLHQISSDIEHGDLLITFGEYVD